MCQPVAQIDAYNADTEPPTEEDEYIDSIIDPQLQTELIWRKFNGALGDNIVLQAISDMFNWTISGGPRGVPRVPRNPPLF